jgi:hypothetical protein
MTQLKMNKQGSSWWSTLTITTLCAGLLVVVSQPGHANSVTFQPPAGNAPSNTRGAAARGSITCLEGQQSGPQQVTLLLPASNQGLTTSERPSFFAYLPKTSAQSVFFSLENQQGQTQYQTMVPIRGDAGILQVNLPQSVAPLEMNQGYRWGIALLCSGKLKPDSPFVSGWVKRVASTADVANGQKASKLELASAYGAQGIWFDMLMALADSPSKSTKNLASCSDWQNLLRSSGLEAIATAPFLR